MFFKNRQEAGVLLADVLMKFIGEPNTIIIALPRGGVVVGYEVAKKLKLPLDLIVPRKIGAPGNPEFAIGAITEDGEGIFNNAVIDNYHIPQEYLINEVAKERLEAIRRVKLYRGERKQCNFARKIVIIVDDGIATGYTMKASIVYVRKKNAGKIIIATPVAAEDIIKELEQIVDEVICVYIPEFFGAVGRFYQHFDQTTDEEVVEIIESYHVNT